MAWQQVIDELATYMATLYADAENYLLEVLAYKLEQDWTIWDDDIARARLINELRATTRTELEYLMQQRQPLAEWVAQTAAEAGAADMRDVILQLLPDTSSSQLVYGMQQMYAQAAVATELVSRLDEVTSRLLRFPTDVHQKVGAVLVTRKLTGQQHTIQFQREMLRDWYRWGIPAFTDTSGRTWRAGSYVEMLTRTGAQRALTEGRRTQLLQSGYPFAVIHELPSACDRCAPWAGQIVSLDGTLLAPATNLLTGEAMTVRAVATIDEARRAGWQHPNCRGTINAYIPGADTSQFERDERNPLNRAEQWLRETERDIRQAKRDLVIDPSDDDARRRLLEAQATARDLTDTYQIARRRWREALDWSGDRIARTERATPPRPPRRGTPPQITPTQSQLDA